MRGVGVVVVVDDFGVAAATVLFAGVAVGLGGVTVSEIMKLPPVLVPNKFTVSEARIIADVVVKLTEDVPVPIALKVMVAND